MESIQEAIKAAKGIVYYGELLLEIKGLNLSNTESLRADALKYPDTLQPAGDVFNVMRNVDALQKAMRGRLKRPLNQLFAGPINAPGSSRGTFRVESRKRWSVPEGRQRHMACKSCSFRSCA